MVVAPDARVVVADVELVLASLPEVVVLVQRELAALVPRARELLALEQEPLEVQVRALLPRAVVAAVAVTVQASATTSPCTRRWELVAARAAVMEFSSTFAISGIRAG